MRLPLVSVIIPTYNRLAMCKRAVQSVLAQTYKNLEIIVVDDNSSDGTFEDLHNTFGAFSNFSLIKLTHNSGACVARNKGIEMSGGDFITFLDSDDEYYPEKVARQLEVFEVSKIPNLGVVSCGRHDFRDGIRYLEWIPKFRGDILTRLLSKKRIGSGTPFLMVKREVFNKGVQFDPMMPAGQDFDFLVQICQYYNFDFVPYALVKVHHHSGARVYNNERALAAAELQYEKYKHLLIGKKAFDGFILKQADLYFTYGERDKALKLVEKHDKSLSWRKYMWIALFKVFNSADTKSSHFFLLLFRKLNS